MDYILLFRWFVGLSVDDPVWDATVFSKNRDRLLAGEIAAVFLSAVLALSQLTALLSNEHFSVDGTLIQAWVSIKSFRRKDGSDEPPREISQQGYQMLFWRQGAMSYWAVSDISADDLRAFVQLYRQQAGLPAGDDGR